MQTLADLCMILAAAWLAPLVITGIGGPIGWEFFALAIAGALLMALILYGAEAYRVERDRRRFRWPRRSTE